MNINFNVVDKPPSELKVVFCLTGNSFSGNFLDSFTDTLHFCKMNDIPHKISRAESSVVYFVRNKALGGDVLRGVDQKPFNGQLDYSHLMWIDNDIIFKPSDFQKLLDHDKDIVSGVYMMQGGRNLATVEKWDEDFFKKNGYFQFWTEDDINNREGLVEVDYTGFGFMLIKKGVFESLKYPWFRPIFHSIGNCTDFSSEDVSFCRLIKEQGYKIFVDPTIRVGHEKAVIL